MFFSETVLVAKVILILGSPGTGKSSLLSSLKSVLADEIIDLEVSKFALDEGLIIAYDCGRKTHVIDLKALSRRIREAIESAPDTKTVVVSSHIPCILEDSLVDMVIVLKASEEVLRKRLRERGWNEEKIEENIEAEMLDVVLNEAKSCYSEDKIFVLDTTSF